MSLARVRRLAAETLGVGEKRIWLDPEYYDRLSTVISRAEIRALIKKGIIKVKPIKGVSRARARLLREKRKKGLRKGPGSKKGKISRKKELWMMRARALRKTLKMLRDKKMISPSDYRKLRGYVKGGMIRTRKQLFTFITEHGMLRKRRR